MEANKCSLVNLKFKISWFFDIFGHHHPDNNKGPTVPPKVKHVACSSAVVVLLAVVHLVQGVFYIVITMSCLLTLEREMA